MAIDTRRERSSMMNFGGGDISLPFPDGDIDASDRSHLLGGYATRVVGVVLRDIRIDFPGLASVEVRPG